MGEERRTQKVCAGDRTGVLQCFSVRRDEISFIFKTFPSAQKVSGCTVRFVWYRHV